MAFARVTEEDYQSMKAELEDLRQMREEIKASIESYFAEKEVRNYTERGVVDDTDDLHDLMKEIESHLN